MRLKLVSILVLLTTLGFGLWPFNFRVENRVRWVESESAVEFGWDRNGSGPVNIGVASTENALDASSWEEISIVLELRGRRNRSGLGTILEIYDPSSDQHSALKIAQWKEHLAIRSGRDWSESDRGSVEIGQRDCISDTEYTRFVLTSDSRGTTLFIGDAEPSFYKGLHLLDAKRPFYGKLLIGNDPTGEQPFLGAIRKLEIYNQKLNTRDLETGRVQPSVRYAFDSPLLDVGSEGWIVPAGPQEMSLIVPYRFFAFEPTLLHSATFESFDKTGFRKDVIMNLLGFMPLGGCLFLIVSKPLGSAKLVPVVGAAVLCMFVSLFIEVSQYWLVDRDSSQLDLFLNTAGGLLGAWLTCVFRPRRPKYQI